MSYHLFKGVHSKPVPTIDERRSPLRFLDKVAVKMRLWIVQAFYTPLGDNRTVVCAHYRGIRPRFSRTWTLLVCHRGLKVK